MYSDTEITVHYLSLMSSHRSCDLWSFHDFLCKGYLVSLFCPDRVLCKNCVGCQNIFAAVFGNIHTKLHAACFPCGDVQAVLLCAENVTLLFKSYLEDISACISEKISVLYGQHAVFYAHSDVGIKLLCFAHFGGICAVCVNYTIRTEAVIARPVVKIAAVNKHSVLVKRLVYVIPDKAALICFILILKVGVKLHSAKGVAHCVHIFTADIGFTCVLSEIFLDLGRLCVHSAFHIGDMVVFSVPHNSLVVNKSGAVCFVEVFRHCCNIIAAVAFVSAAPYQHACVVLVTLVHRPCSVEAGFFPLGKRSRDIYRRLTSAHLLPSAVAFEICFGNKVNAVLVAKFIPK